MIVRQIKDTIVLQQVAAMNIAVSGCNADCTVTWACTTVSSYRCMVAPVNGGWPDWDGNVASWIHVRWCWQVL